MPNGGTASAAMPPTASCAKTRRKQAGNSDTRLSYWSGAGRTSVGGAAFRPRPRLRPLLGDDLDAAVLGSTSRRVVARDRLRLAPATRGDAGRVDALRDH